MQTERTTEVMKKLSSFRIVPVIRTGSQDLAYQAVKSLAGVGFKTAEITMTVPGAVELIKEFSQDSRLLIGAGTVYSIQEAQACIRAGARYIVSPVIVDDMPEICIENEVLCIMSGLTPNEVLTAWQRGSGVVKIFPADAMGGQSYLKALKSIFPSIPLVPTGGVNLQNVQDYLRAGASFVGVGSELVGFNQDPKKEAPAMVELGKMFLQAVSEFKEDN